jgi:phospholipase/carboxylesterase
MINYTKSINLHNIELDPAHPPLGSVLWLHGLGADGHDFVPIVSELHLSPELPLRFIFPHAPLRPVTINNGYVMRAWFDIAGVPLDQQIDEAGIARSVTLVNQWIEEEIERNIPANKIILAGFSQGAVIALHAGLRYPKKLGGIIALSGALPAFEKLFAEKSPANDSTPIFMAHGVEDAVIPILLGQASADLLKKQGYPLTWRSYPMAHSVCKEETQDISKWLTSAIKGSES